MFEIIPDRFYSESEMLGLLKCSRATLFRHRQSGRLTCSRIGNQNYFLGHDLLQWLHFLGQENREATLRRFRVRQARKEFEEDGRHESEQ